GWINRNRRKHIITLEDPIEYRHRNALSTVTQREIGADTASFRVGLRHALRQDPDAILIGEMRDSETIEIAMEAAETGQLVISTFHAPTAIATLGHFMAMFPGDNEELVRQRVAESLRAIVSQRLLLRKDEEEGRVPVVEVLRLTGAVQEAIQRREPQSEIKRLMQQGEQYGMQTFDQHLMKLVRDDIMDYDTAKAAATSPSDFELVMQTLSTDEDEDGDGPGAGFF
ncbi:MAG TPA: ATPase, T2SS/T4P/T4SS family, partial [Gemmatimonadota bacterium]|nr:ATPase, T2SS/T4P/T4SS family [Gemmatimonadota bacterium]